MKQEVEYQSLRQEILEYINREFNLISFTTTATAIIIGYGITSREPLIFLVPLLIHFMTLRQLVNTISGTLRLASYIRVFIEEQNTNLNWETSISRLRAKLWSRKSPSHIIFSSSPFEEITISMGIVCMILALGYSVFYAEEFRTPVATVVIIVSLAWLYLSFRVHRELRYARSTQYEQALENEWKEILDSKAKIK